MSPTESYTDVLVIGAGPSGLVAANALSGMGIKVQVIEKRAPNTPGGQADGIQPRTLEVWRSYGILDGLMQKGAQLHKLVLYVPNEANDGIKKQNQAINVDLPGLRYPFTLTVRPSLVEDILRSSLSAKGVEITQPFTPVSLEVQENSDASHPVKVVIRRSKQVNGSGAHPNSTGEYETINAKYVIGADGAYSWVREALGIQMEGSSVERLWGVMDFRTDTNFPDYRAKAIVQSPHGTIVLIPRFNGTARTYVAFPEGEKQSANEMAPERMIDMAKNVFLPYKFNITKVYRSAYYRVSQKIATKFSDGKRVFIVGDACHTHSPNAGQGANVSMMDSHNLAWKLAYVLRGWASPSLLDTYNIERRPVAHALIEFDRLLVGKITPDQLSSDAYREVMKQGNMLVAGVGVKYTSRLTTSNNQSLAPYMPLGERVPPGPLACLSDWLSVNLQDLVLSNGLFKVLIFSGVISEDIQLARLETFTEALLGRLSGAPLEMSEIFTVIKGKKEAVEWEKIPERLRDFSRVFVDETGENTPGDEMPTKDMSRDGVALLIRPDGYISLISELSPKGAEHIVTALENL